MTEKAPDFALPNQDGITTTLADLKGEWAILYFYPKDDTPGCTTEACDFTNSLNRLPGRVIGVSPDSGESHRKFIDKHQLKIELLSDPEKKVLNAYGAWGIKKNYGKEYEGVIRSTVLINPQGEIVKKWSNVKATGHVERVVAFLSSL